MITLPTFIALQLTSTLTSTGLISYSPQHLAIARWNDREPGQIGLATVARPNGQAGLPERRCWYVKPDAEVRFPH